MYRASDRSSNVLCRLIKSSKSPLKLPCVSRCGLVDAVGYTRLFDHTVLHALAIFFEKVLIGFAAIVLVPRLSCERCDGAVGDLSRLV